MSLLRRREMYKVSVLPNGYKRCKYIETNGSQYIDTKYLSRSTDVRIITEIVSNSLDQNIPVFGCRWYQNSSSNHTFYHITPYNDKWYLGANNIELNCGIYNAVPGLKYNIDFNNEGKVYINGIQLISNTAFIPNGNILLSGRGNTTTDKRKFGSWKYYTFDIYKSDELVRNFIPVLDNHDVPCMYDTISKQTFYNSGTGKLLYELA